MIGGSDFRIREPLTATTARRTFHEKLPEKGNIFPLSAQAD
jgi:hypothetical protein